MNPDPELAPLIKSLFMDFFTGNYLQNQPRKKHEYAPLKLTKSNLSSLLTQRT